MAEILVPGLLSEDIKNELQEAASGGVGKLKQYIQQRNEEWKKIPLNIGITGDAGVGKSSFINAIRGLSEDDEECAHVDVVEATRTITPYKHPTNENVILWDLPVVGTPNFPRSSYLDDVKFDLFDFFLILSAGRFREADLWLAEEICKRKKNFHFVRTKIDEDVRCDRKSHPKTHSKSKVIEKVRADYLANLEEHGLSRASVFLIDNYAPREFDFNSLTITLFDEALIHKKEAMAQTMSVLTGVLERKLEALSGRIYKVALLSALGGAIPIPGLSATIDSAILLEEIVFYKTQLGLDRKTMEENARILNTDARVLEKKLGLQSADLATTAEGLAHIFTWVDASESVETALPLAIPVIGGLISAGISYGVTSSCLRYILKVCSDDARKINEELMNKALY